MLKLKPFWGLEVPFLCQNIFFIFGRFIRKYNKLRWAWVTLGDALKNYFLFISSLSMSKQPEKPWGAWLFKLFAFLRHPTINASFRTNIFCDNFFIANFFEYRHRTWTANQWGIHVHKKVTRAFKSSRLVSSEGRI